MPNEELITPHSPSLPPPEAVAIVTEKDTLVSDAEALKILKGQGLTKLTAHALANLAKVGIHAKGVGVMDIQLGGAIVSQQWLLEAINVLGTKMIKKQISIKSAVSVAKALGFTARAHTELMNFISHTQGVKTHDKNPEDSKPKVPSFPPGVNIQINNPPGTQPASVIVSEKPVAETAPKV